MEKQNLKGDMSKRSSRKYSVHKYLVKHMVNDLEDNVVDFISRCGIPEPMMADGTETFADDLIFVEGGAGMWNAGGKIHYNEALLAVRSWVSFCLGNALGCRRDAEPAATLTVSVERYGCSGGLGVRLAFDGDSRCMSMMLLPCYSNKYRLGGWASVSALKKLR